MKNLFLCISTILLMTTSLSKTTPQQHTPDYYKNMHARHTTTLIAGMLCSCGLSLFTLYKARENIDNPAIIPLISISLISSYGFLTALWQENQRIEQLTEEQQKAEHKEFVAYIMKMPEH